MLALTQGYCLLLMYIDHREADTRDSRMVVWYNTIPYHSIYIPPSWIVPTHCPKPKPSGTSLMFVRIALEAGNLELLFLLPENTS